MPLSDDGKYTYIELDGEEFYPVTIVSSEIPQDELGKSFSFMAVTEMISGFTPSNIEFEFYRTWPIYLN